jgi:hypothetical protein
MTAGLLQGNRRWKPGDVPHPGRSDLIHQPACVRGDGLEEPPLRFGVDGAEGQRRLPRSRDPGERDDAVPGNEHIDVGEVVFSGVEHCDSVEFLGM